jgi:hypothetical protein
MYNSEKRRDMGGLFELEYGIGFSYLVRQPNPPRNGSQYFTCHHPDFMGREFIYHLGGGWE